MAEQIRATRANPAFAVLIGLETALGRLMVFPFGIRCVLSLKKPLA